MRIYLASRYGRKDEMICYSIELAKMRHVVTSHWIHSDYVDRPGESSVAPEEERQRMAVMDEGDLQRAEAVISFTESPDDCNGKRGGRHVEFGMARALGKRLIVVGPRENVFHHLPDVEVYATWEEAKSKL